MRIDSNSNKTSKRNTQNSAILYIKCFSIPLISIVSNLPCEFIHLKPDKAYSIGRNYRRCEFVFSDCKVSNIHCCLLFNSLKKKVYICDGYGFSFGESGAGVRVSSNGVFVNGEKVVKGVVKELGAGDEVSLVCRDGGHCGNCVKIGFLIEKVLFLEEVVDGEVDEVCDNSVRLNDPCIPKASVLLSMCRGILYSNNPVSYIRRFVGVVDGVRNIGCKRKRASDFFMLPCSHLEFPISNILDEDVQNHLCQRESPSDGNGIRFTLENKPHQNVVVGPQKDFPLPIIDKNNGDDIERSNTFLEGAIVSNRITELRSCNSTGTDIVNVSCRDDEVQSAEGIKEPHEKTDNFQLLSCNDTNREDNKQLNKLHEEGVMGSHKNIELKTCNASATDVEKVNCCDDELQSLEGIKEPEENAAISDGSVVVGSTNSVRQAHISGFKDVPQAKFRREPIPSPGKKFYLNRLKFMDYSSDTQDVISLPELFYPIESLQRVFIATFTSDIRWFLEYCSVPVDLPVTIACHSAERCWSPSPDYRSSTPYSDFPNLAVVYPPFPEVIAFAQDLSRSGIACHHPKFLILQRENSVRVVITSANLVAKQWLLVTNTVWWQDFPRSDTPSYLSLFTQLSDAEINKDSDCDFAAQLAGYVATLIVDVPSQAHWIQELPKFDFNRAVGYLVASVPGIHSARCPYISDSKFVLVGGNSQSKSLDAKLLGSVEVSVVGLSYLFRTTVDADGSRLKKLAAFLGKCRVNEHGMSEVVLRRVTNIQADTNAVSVLVPNPERHSMQDFVQVGFLPKNIAKWVAPLSDVGLFAFSAYIYPKEVLTTALEGSNRKVQLILYVTQGPSFSSISEIMQPEHVSALSSLLASIQRCFGLWRFQEVLSRYKWPEHLETEFVFGSSSVGAVNAHFLAAFSAASGKKSLNCTDSEESDPDWGCWSASQELRSPSIRIIFPTIERVKKAACGIIASKYLLCFSQKTWQRLRTIGILHDAVPHPNDRIGLPMHVKVARRRFQSNNESPFGWVYCGSHNFSAAAWGRPISSSVDKPAARDKKKPVLGLRLHISNYELGIVFVVHPSNTEANPHQMDMNLDDITLPFVVPAPKYTWMDKPATKQAMWEALSELSTCEREKCETVGVASECMEEEIPVEEDDVMEADVTTTRENEDEKVYADKLWSHVDSSRSR
ncbi:phosphodiesterase [Lithospermum erythrorhizon]|uniref:Phosphodiesterase n=1 Tax=Lithospermum erythrorhizon TaxID=34254 RepID=A0AAV3PYT1_LITER